MQTGESNRNRKFRQVTKDAIVVYPPRYTVQRAT